MNPLGKRVKKIPYLWRKLIRYLKYRGYKYQKRDIGKMKVNLVYQGTGWILDKFAESVFNELSALGVDVFLSKSHDKSADINHYFIANYVEISNEQTTFMITHVDTARKVEQIREYTNKGAVGVCMSLDTRDKLIANGIKASKLCYIHPAQDGQILPRKISLGFTHRVYDDCRKRETMILDICKEIDSRFFCFKIMGAGWEGIIEELNAMGFEVEYYPNFDKQKYNELITNLDFYCYFGFDEGSMGYLDAVAAGIGTIVTPQGYHKETECEITYPVTNIDEIVDALLDIQRKRMKSVRFASEWTWEAYAKKHLEVWKYMTRSEDLDQILSTRGWYTDGIYSLMVDDLDSYKSLSEKIEQAKKEN